MDPACGSGAYLLGMMQELVELQAALYKVRIDNRSLYDLKLHIIQRNLHGVDNDEFAVNIAMLRMWLSLSIEYEGPTPEPLPNLDFKVVLGDSLLGPDPSTGAVVQGALGRDMKQITLLGKLKAEYSRTSNGSKKGRLRRQIELIEGRVSAALGESELMAGVVDWRVKFAEVFFQNGGFDVVLANPPYVVTKDALLRKMYKDGVYGRMNTYGLFIQRSLQLLCENGQQLFINPRTLLTDRYFSSLRKVINEKADLHGVVLIQDRHNTFARVLQECIILHLGKFGSTPNNAPIRTRSVWRPDDLNDTTAYYEVFPCRVLLGEDYDGSWYIGTSDEEYSVFERMFSVGKRLSDFGLKAETGKIQFDKYEFYAQPAMSGNACRLIWAENVQRYKMRDSKKRLGKEWLSNSISTFVSPNITGKGIMTQRVSANEQPRRIIATLIDRELVGSNKVYSENHTNFIALEGSPINANFFLGVLNSSVVEYIFRRLNSNTQVSAGEINKLPFPPIPNDETLSEFDALVQRLLEIGGVDCQPSVIVEAIECERRLDQLVGYLYGFSVTEVEQIQQQLPSHEIVYGSI